MADKIVIDVTTKGTQAAAGAFSKMGASVVALNQGLQLAKSAGTALISPFKSIVAEGSAFASQMATVASISKTTTKEFKEMSDEAKRIGETTSFSATEAAQGMEELKRAGQTTAQTLKTTSHAMSLSAATGMDLSSAAKATALNMKLFSEEGLTAEKTVNLLNQTAGAALTDVPLLAAALEKTGASASAVGISFKDTTQILGAMANAGTRGSEAGTALNGALRQLITPTAESQKALTKLGISVDEINPKSNSFASILETLKTKGAQFEDVVRILGAEAGPKFVKMIQQGGSSITDFAASQANANTAMESAKIKMNTLEGDTKIFSSTMSGIKIKVFEALEPLLRKVVQGASALGTALSKNFGTAKKAFGTFLVAIGTGLKAIGAAMSSSSGSFSTILSNIKATASTVFTAIKGFLVDNKKTILSVVSSFGTFISKITTLASIITSALMPVIKPLATLFLNIGNVALKAMNRGLEKLVGFMKDVSSTLTDSTAFKFFNKWVGKATEAAAAFSDELAGHSVTTSADAAGSSVDALGDDLIALGTDLQKTTVKTEGLSTQVDKAKDSTDGLKTEAKKAAKEVDKLGKAGSSGSFSDGLFGKAGTKSASEMAGGAVGKVASQVTGVGGAISGFQQGGPMGAAIGAITDIALANPKIQEALGKISEILGEVLAPVIEAVLPILDAFIPLLEALAPAMETLGAVLKVTLAPIAIGIFQLSLFIRKLGEIVPNLIKSVLAIPVIITALPIAIAAVLVKATAELGLMIGKVMQQFLIDMGNAFVKIGATIGTAVWNAVSGLGTVIFNSIKNIGSIIADAVKNILPMGGGGGGKMFGLFEDGGQVPKAQGGMLVGNRHSGGGIPIEAEGGEFIMKKDAVDRIGADKLADMNSGTGGTGVNITMNINAIDPSGQKEELRQVMEELFLSGRLKVA